MVATAIVLGTGVGSIEFSRNLGNVLEILAPALAAVCCFQVARRARGSWRIGWYLVGASCASWGVGQSIWTWLESVQGQISPFPSAADFFFLLAVPLSVAGLLWFPSSPDTQSGRARTLLDGIIVAASVLFVSWTVVLGPTLHNGASTGWSRAIGLAYPAADVVVLTIVIIAYVRCDPAGRVAVGLVGLAFASFALADSLFAYNDLHGENVSEVSNTAWVAGYLLIALGAYYARLHPPGEVSPAADVDRGTRVQVLLPYVPLAVVLALCVGEALVTDPLVVDNVVFWIGAGLIALLLVRQGIVIVENTRLARSLAMSNERLQYQVLHDVLTVAAQPTAAHRPAAHGAVPDGPGRRGGGDHVRRPRPVQAGERHLRARGGRQGARHPGAAPARPRCAPATRWPASAATSSWCCARTSPAPTRRRPWPTGWWRPWPSPWWWAMSSSWSAPASAWW